MRQWATAAAAVAFAAVAAAANAKPLPQAAADMITAVADDPQALATVVRAARKANPGSLAEIDALVATLGRQAAAKKLARAESQGFFEGWTGRADFGGSVSTGNTEDQGFTLELKLDQETKVWDRELVLTADHKREDDETTKERYFGTYAVRYKISPRFYTVGMLWGERDRFAGYNTRFAESLGLGYRLIDRPAMKLRVEAGPALRQADYLETGREVTVAARLADYFTWKVAPRVEFTQSLVVYLDERNSTLLASTAISTSVERHLSVRASYEVRHEEDPPLDRQNTDTTTRVTVAYSF